MRAFTYQRVRTPLEAAQAAAATQGSRFIAGGTNLLDLMKLQVETPDKLIDISRLDLDQIEEREDGGLTIGALVPNSDLAADPRVIANYEVLSRALLGFATSSFLMAPVALYARWFAPSRFSTISGIHLGIGSFGALFATAPLAFAAAHFGWRTAFLAIGTLTIALGAIAWFVVQDDPPGVRMEKPRETLRQSLAGIWQVIRTPSIGRVFLVHLGCVGGAHRSGGAQGGSGGDDGHDELATAGHVKLRVVGVAEGLTLD